MDFTNVKLLLNPLRQDMSNVKYFSTAGCYSNSKFYKNDLENISNHLFKLSTLELSTSKKKFAKLNGRCENEFNEHKIMPTIISLKNVILNSLSSKNMYAVNSSKPAVAASASEEDVNNLIANNVFNQSMLMPQEAVVSSSQNVGDDSTSIPPECSSGHVDTRKLTSPKRLRKNVHHLQARVKNLKKSPNLTFYRNLIEEIAAERKIVSKMMSETDKLTPNFVIIKNANSSSLIAYEIRFKEAKHKNIQHKFIRYSDNRTRAADAVGGNLQPIEDSYNQFNPLLDCERELLTNIRSNIENTLDRSEECIDNRFNYVGDCDQEDSDDDSYIVFGDSDDEDSSSDEQDPEDKRQPKQSLNTCQFLTAIASTQILSDCESEDSFIMFAEDGEDTDDEEEDDTDEDDNEDPDCAKENGRRPLLSAATDDESDGSEDDDEPNTSCLQQIQIQMIVKSIGKKVQFKPDSELCIVHPMVQWSYAYHTARKGKWEEAARDRTRFQCRLRRMSDIIKPILTVEHRHRIFTERFHKTLDT